MSRLVIYGPCLNCGFRDLENCSVTFFDKDIPGELGRRHRWEEHCLKETICKRIGGLSPLEWEEGE